MNHSIWSSASVSQFNRKYLFLLLTVISLSFFYYSCSKETSPTQPQEATLPAATIEKLEAAADKVATYTPGLMVYIAKEGEGEIFIKRGVSNTATNEPVDENNYFRIASITKTFTTEAVLILVDKGLIDLNKTISYYLPEYNIPGSNQITIRMLGNMTSGLFSFTSDTTFSQQLYLRRGEWVFCPAELIFYTSKYPLKFTPGSQYDYCNSNTVILGEIIRKVTGKSIATVFTEEIFQPLGMKYTFWPSSRYIPSPYSHGYSANVGSLIDVTYWNPTYADAAGILISNLEDLKKWAKEISGMNLLSAASMMERYTWIDEDPLNPGQNYYGFGLMKFRDWVGHSGVIEGFNTQIYYNTVKKITIITATNTQDNSPAEGAFHFFADIMENK